MQSYIGLSKFLLAVCLVIPAVTAYAADVALDCNKKSIFSEIGKLDKLAANKVTISGSCTEDIVIDGHLNLTLVGTAGASISATASHTTTLAINNSSVTVQALTLNGGYQGATCENRSTCIFHDVTVQGGSYGVSAQGQSAIDIIGASSVLNTDDTGVGVYGASSVNIRPTWANGFDPAEPGPVISGHPFGALVQDGSFLRTDNVTISGNGTGVWAQRNATIKILANSLSGASVRDNFEVGVGVVHGSVGQLIINFTNNGQGVGGWAAIAVGPLSYVRGSGSTFSGNLADVSCYHPTAVVQGGGLSC